jgi:hypothetical protein
VRVDAPFKIGFNPSGANGASMNMLDDAESADTGGRRFSRTRGPATPPPAPLSNNPEDPLGLEQSAAPPAGQAAPPAQQFAPQQQSGGGNDF